ncbi:bifunctional phosphoribosylaminoimidazolecarboxamide formyltransferase/IMP cyclohydrolase [Lentibacillus salinarum]|uniref:Bifunctional purine biosynthesis protein PurH n=1 Tax=Lentibacillus salinarum TaxID=446820 RepID=A0ABW3ZSS6_9BACI
MNKQVLISVSDKTGIVDFARGLAALNYDIISTGGTLRTLKEAGVAVKAVEDVTGFPEMLDGRVKTLHPIIHAGLLAKRDDDRHRQQMLDKSINPIDIVVVNLYPFKQTFDQSSVTKAEVIENIDIGGPAMLRAAAKSFRYVSAVVDPDDYKDVLQAIQHDKLDTPMRKQLAAKVFRHTAQYDTLIAGYFTDEAFPENFTVTYEKVQTLRYGENPHQQAAFYKKPYEQGMSLASGRQLHGKELSYNNIQDANAALEIIAEYAKPAAVAVKHMNPCGIGVSEDVNTAFSKAYRADPVSIFGGIVACNRPIDVDTAEQLSSIFLEIIIAPGFTDEGFTILTKKKNIRLLEVKMDEAKSADHQLTTVKGGVLIQGNGPKELNHDDLIFPTETKPTEADMTDLWFAWKTVKHVKSNAIVLAKDQETIGIGAGQMNRIGAAKISLEQAGDKAEGAVLASDAFFPMPDTAEEAAKAGIKAIIQPGGSKRDQDSIDVCNQYGIAMVMTGTRHFKH